MASDLKNLSVYKHHIFPHAEEMKIGIVVAEWNEQVTSSMFEGAKKTLLESGVKIENIMVKYVPGSFELPTGASFLLEKNNFDAIICIGCVIQGETRHFEFICQAVSQGIMQLCIKYNKPVIFGVLTTNTMQQAIERSGGIHGNKGEEAAYTALRMITLQKSL